MVILAVNFTATVAGSEDLNSSLRLVSILGLLVAGLYLLCGVVAFWNYSFSGVGVEGVHRSENAIDARISTVRDVSKALGDLVGNGQPVISFWPGYLVDCDCVPQDGMENEYALAISRKLTPTAARQRKIITYAGVRDLLKSHFPRTVVVRVRNGATPFRDLLQGNGYKPVRSIGQTEIYLWKGN